MTTSSSTERPILPLLPFPFFLSIMHGRGMGDIYWTIGVQLQPVASWVYNDFHGLDIEVAHLPTINGMCWLIYFLPL